MASLNSTAFCLGRAAESDVRIMSYAEATGI